MKDGVGFAIHHSCVHKLCIHFNPIGPRACYDEGKRCAETLFFDYYRQNRVNIRVARIFNTYGPRMHPDDGRVVSNFIVRALRDDPIPIYGDGTQTRSFCFVEDMIDGLVRMMEGPDEFIGPVNLGNPVEHTMLELAELVIRLTKSSSGLEFLPPPLDDQFRVGVEEVEELAFLGHQLGEHGGSAL
mgnify:CR=1 FL=1